MSAPPIISADIWDSLIPIDDGAADSADADADQPQTVTTTVTTPAATSTPAPSYQHYQAYAHYQHQQPAYQAQPTYQAQPAYQSYQSYQAQAPSMARAAIANSQAANAGALDTADVATLNDALGSAGVDLRAEEERLQRSHDQPQSFQPFEDRARKQPQRPAFDVALLGATMRAIAARHSVTAGVPADCVNYLALALRARLQDLVTGMIDAARHRAQAQFDRAPGLYGDGTAAWGVRVHADVARQLEALERAERAEEEALRRARAVRERAVDTALAAVLAGEDVEVPAGDDGMDVDGGGGGDGDGDARKRRKKDKEKAAVSEEAGRRMANAAASRAAGITGRYAWLTAKPRSAAPPVVGAPRDGDGDGLGWARPYKATRRGGTPPPLPPDADQRMRITIRDAMFVVEKERGHGGGRGAARGWT
ncbi:transcription initiation factor TFIID component TAF4 family-domain-containing protein [Mycena maculata]|uniref:Transcription initiation factor TFIID subunit 4 n=1 Tax=Mycena maculata TaxID=230809 RepID=A0AAD7HI00_9AGAR|nr:transcription initiation factor TFIID component TAF4 family-domain-containing protein [Mycena maculata]